MRNAVLIAGAVLTLVLVAAAAIPPLIDWSAYGGTIAARVQAATGRPVTIDGPIALRLLPAPALSAGGVAIGNPPGMDGHLVRADKLRLKVALLPLFTGTVRLTALELDQPVVTLARDGDGRANWRFDDQKDQPAEEPHRRAARPEEPAAAPADDALPVERLIVRDGTVRLPGGAEIAGLDLDIALGGRSGPFQGSGGARLGGVTVALEGAVDRLGPGRAAPATLSLRLPGDDAVLELSGLVSRLSGGDTLRGRLTGRAAEPGRSLARLGLTPPLPPGPLALGADVTLSAEEAVLSPLELTVGETKLTGAVSAALAGTPQVDVKLAAAALNLDTWTRATAKAEQAAPAASAPPAQSAPTAQPARTGTLALPRDLFLSANLAVDSLTWRGQAVRQARLEAVLDGGEIMLRQAAARLPGDSELVVEGGIAAAAFDGSVRLQSDNARALAAWLGAGDTGPKRLELASPVAVAWPDIKLSDIRLTADGVAARGSMAARLGDQPALALAATVPGLELTARGRVAGGGKVEDGSFKLTSSQGLRPLRAFGLTPPPALDRLGPLNAEGTASGSLDALAVDARAESGGVTVAAKGTLAQLDKAPRGDLGVTARAASLGQVLRLFGDGKAQGGGAFALDARLVGDAKAFDVGGLSLRAGPSSLGGHGRVELAGTKPLITAELTADTLALDSLTGAERSGRLLPGGPLVPPTAAPQAAPVVPAALVGAGTSPFSREPLDLGVLNAVDARLSLRAQTVTAKAWRLDNAVMQAVVQNGTATVDRLTGRLLGGELTASAKLSAGATPALSGQLHIAGADLGAARLAAAGMSVTHGRLDAEAKFTTAGRSSQDMAARLNGDGRLLVRNGVLDGFDLPAVNRQMGNLRNLGSVLGVVQAGLSGGKTPFTQLAGTFRADNGVVTSRDLKLEADGGGATADTTVNLPDWATQTRIAFHLASAPQTPVAVRLDGPLENPRKIVDLNAIQQFMVSQGLGKALRGDAPADGPQQADQPREKNTGKNILKNLLKGLGGQ